MGARTTVAVDDSVRRRIKKLSALLDESQGEIIEKAIADFEQKVLRGGIAGSGEEVAPASKRVEELFRAATKAVWASDPDIKEVQQRLLATPGTIDDFIIDRWESGLEP